jgi:hypothetical protein
MKRSLPARLLHLLLAAAIVRPLAASLLMPKPEPGRPENLGFELHQGVALASAGILVIFWALVLVRRREHGIATLVPRFSAPRRRGTDVLHEENRWRRSMRRGNARLEDPADRRR